MLADFLSLPRDGDKPIDKQMIFTSVWLIIPGVIFDIETEAHANIDSTEIAEPDLKTLD